MKPTPSVAESEAGNNPSNLINYQMHPSGLGLNEQIIFSVLSNIYQSLLANSFSTRINSGAFV